jgi:DNA-binding MarR family transcriptional regulator
VETNCLYNRIVSITTIRANNLWIRKKHLVQFLTTFWKLQGANVTKLSKTFRLTRGAISKLVKRLIKVDAIESYQKPENKKEIYYKHF